MNNKKIVVLALMSVVVSIALSTTVHAADYYDWTGTSEELGFLACLSGAMCIVPIIILILWIVLAVWVYKDAQKRDGNGVIWLLIVLVTGIIGLIVWFVVRPPIGGKQAEGVAGTVDRRCPNCGRSIPNDAQNCPYCGKNFNQ